VKQGSRLAALRYPRSFLELLVLGFGLVALPLILALLNAAADVDRLTSRSQSAVDNAAAAVRNSRVLMEQVTAMERLARQFLILHDAALLNDYAKVRGNFERTASELLLLPIDPQQLQAISQTVEQEAVAFAQLGSAPAAGDGQQRLIQAYGALSEFAAEVQTQSNLLIDREVMAMGEAARHAQRSMLWQLVASFAFGVLIAWLFAYLLARPIRQLDRAIRQLGGADLAAPIQVRGPADLELLGDRLEWLRQRLQELQEQKSRFLHTVSHELKTPLTALREGSELLADGTSGALNAQQSEIAGILRSNSVQLQRLIEGLLGYQQALNSVDHLTLATLDLAELAREVAAAHKLASAARDVKIELRLKRAVLSADRDKLRVVLDNLLSNAVKFSPHSGTVSLSVKTLAERAVVDVRDDGPGIPPGDRERVFDWFFQGKLGHEGRIKSSGLGLAIAREFVQAHHGSIEVIAGSGSGAHLRVILPLRHA